MLSGSRPDSRSFLGMSGTARGGDTAHCIGDGLDMRGRGTAATADDIDKARLRKFLDQTRGIFRRLVIAGFRQADLAGRH